MRADRVGWTLGLCFCAALAEGFDIQSMGVAAPTLAPALALSRDQLGPAFSASIVGLLIGALILGRMADRVGRKRTLILSLTVFGVFSAATAFAWNLNSLLAIRLLAGLGLGGAMPNLIALSAEAAAVGRRARMVTLMAAGFPFGAAVAGGVAALLGWKGVFLTGGAAPLALALLMAPALPESRGFLETRAARRDTQAPPDGFPEILFGGGRAKTTLLLWIAFFASLLSLYLLLNWLPTLIVAKGVSKASASLVSVLFNVGGGFGVLVLAALLGGGRRSWTMAVWYAALAVSLVALAGAHADLASVGATGLAVGVFASSAPIALYGLAPGHYAVAMRGAGVGASVAVGRLGAIVGPLLAAALLGAGAGVSGVLLALLPLVAVACAATLGLLRRPTVDE